MSPSTALLEGALPVRSCHIRQYNLLETVDSEPVPHDTIRNIRSPSIELRVTLVGQKTGRQISARALLDSRAEGLGLVIDDTFA